MIASRRWEDWATTLIGALVGLSPALLGNGFSTTGTFAETAAVCSAVGMGGLIFIAGVLTLIFPRAGWLDYVQGVFAVVLFLTPFLFGFTGLTMAWVAYAGAIAVIAVVGARLFTSGPALTPTS